MEESTKRIEADPTGKFGIELSRIKSDMAPGSIRIVETGGLLRKKKCLICYTSDENIIIVDLESGEEIYRSDRS